MNYLKLQVEAQAAGLIRYDGKPCKKCGSTERYARNGNCAPCTVATAKKWKESNSEKINEGRRRWRSENREYLSTWFREYRKKKYAQGLGGAR